MQRDEFFWTSTINKATIVVNAAEGLLSNEAAREAAGGVARLEAKAEKDPALRVKSYIAYEPLLIAETSPAVTLIHAGRSSQDILSTQRTAILRDRTLQVAKAFDAVIGKLLDLAEANRHTIVPNYTNGVAAQPNSYAHYLLGITAAFLRDRERLNECLTRYNACAMGSTVLNGTGWPLNREAMAVRLGFPAPRRNAFDATCMSPADMPFRTREHQCVRRSARRQLHFRRDGAVRSAAPLDPSAGRRREHLRLVRDAAKAQSRSDEQLPRRRFGRGG